MRYPVVAGAFYALDADELKNQIKDCFLSRFGPGKLPGKDKKQGLKGVIVPHAGYFFSGPCAAHSYKAIAEAEKPDLFIILGFSHSGLGSSVSLEDWKTPLGIAKVDKDFGKRLVEAGIPQDELAHAKEHSIEVQLPFLQFIFDDFKFVPMMVSEDYKKIEGIIKDVLKESKKTAVLIASSDFTHFGKDYGFVPFEDDIKDQMYNLDAGAIKEIMQIDAKRFIDYVNKTGATICGKNAVAVLLECMKPAKAKLLKYYTSADIYDQDYSTAVGYAAVSFFHKE